MKVSNRCSYPDSPHPGHGYPSDWIAKPYSIMFTGVVLFILIFGFTIFLGWRQFETTRHNALMADRTTANLLADLILEHNIDAALEEIEKNRGPRYDEAVVDACLRLFREKRYRLAEA